MGSVLGSIIDDNCSAPCLHSLCACLESANVVLASVDKRRIAGVNSQPCLYRRGADDDDQSRVWDRNGHFFASHTVHTKVTLNR